MLRCDPFSFWSFKARWNLKYSQGFTNVSLNPWDTNVQMMILANPIKIYSAEFTGSQ